MINMLAAPWRASLTMTATTLEAVLTMQKAMLGQVGDHPTGSLPMFNPPNETEIREAFHKAAGDNLRRWEDLADVLQSLPSWTHEMNRLPGTILTDWFDAARRNADQDR